jgi:hypothetical protein
MSTERDDLADALRVHGGAPEHGADFMSGLAAALAEADHEMGRPVRRAWWRRALVAPGGHRLRLAFAGVLTLVVVTIAGLAGLPAGQRVVEQFSGGAPGQDPVFPGPEPARAETVSEVLRITQQALRAARTITGDYGQWIGRPGSEPRFDYDIHVVFAADGSRWVSAGHTTSCWELTYDAVAGEKRVWFGEFRPSPLVLIVSEEYSGVPPGEPDGGDSRALFDHPTPGGMGWELYGAIANAARRDPHAKVETARFDGRRVWVVRCPVMPQAPEDAAGSTGVTPDQPVYELTVSVDQQTGLPVRVQAWIDGRLRAEGRLVNVRVNETVPADTFTSAAPESATVRLTDKGRLSLRVDVGTRTTRMRLPYDPAQASPDDVRVSIARAPRVAEDMGFRRLSIDQVGPATGRAALIPAWIPAGFRLTVVAVKDRQRPSGLSGDPVRQSARVGTGIVMLHYEAGFQAITVTTRALDPAVTSKAAAVRIDPFIGDRWPGWTNARTPAEVTGGAFAGAKGAVVIAPLTMPHLWAVRDGVLLTVAGDCTSEELLAIAGSMEPWTAGAEAPVPALGVIGQ